MQGPLYGKSVLQGASADRAGQSGGVSARCVAAELVALFERAVLALQMLRPLRRSLTHTHFSCVSHPPTPDACRCLSMATIRWICGCTTPGATSARVPLPKPARSTTGPSEYSRNSSTPTSSRGIRRRCAATRSDARSESLVVVESAHRRRWRGIRVAQASRRRSRSRDGQPPASLKLRSFGHAWTRSFAPMPRRHEPSRGSRARARVRCVYMSMMYVCV